MPVINTNLILNTKELLELCKEHFTVPVIRRSVQLTAVIIKKYSCYQRHTFYTTFFFKD
jgi:hypothetical protein